MKTFAFFFITFLLVSCTQPSKKAILLADREAPLGWVYLRVFEDYSFEFESRGLERKGQVYAGLIELKKDTIIFIYNDSIPKAGTKALIRNDYVSYLEGTYPESLKIKLNELRIN